MNPPPTRRWPLTNLGLLRAIRAINSTSTPTPTQLCHRRHPANPQLAPHQPRPAPCYLRHQFHFHSHPNPTLPPSTSRQLASPRSTSRTDDTLFCPQTRLTTPTSPQAHR